MSSSVPAEMRVCQQESPPPSSIAPSLSPSIPSPEPLAPIDGTAKGAFTAEHPGGRQQGLIQVTIDILPYDVLVEIFHFYLDLFLHSRRSAGWRALVQVCQRWRNLVFGSPRYLDVKLRCGTRTSLREMLDVWPALPISIRQHSCSILSQVERENLLAILELHQRVCEIDFTGMSSELLEQVGKKMQKPFPALTELLLESSFPSPLAWELPNSFLGGSAPRLRVLEFDRIPCPALPNLLMTTTDLRYLCLSSIPPSAYIPSQVMVTCLSQMTRLKVLVIKFYSSRSQHSKTTPPSPSPTRTILPALTYLRFQGWCSYLEDLVASIDVPLLNTMSLSFFKRETYNTPQLSKFISCTNQLQSPRRVDAVFYDHTIKVKLYLQTGITPDSVLDLEIIRRDPDQRLISLAQLCQSLSFLSTLERLDIRRGKFDDSALTYNIENAGWLELLRRFTGVKNLHITKPLGLPVMSALAALAGNGVTVLPALQNIFLEGLQQSGPLRDNVDQLIATRQCISVHHWSRWEDMLQETHFTVQANNLQRLQESQQQRETSSQSTVFGQ